MVRVKIILSNSLGFDSGLYYDILAANAYGRQLNEEVRPLTTNQKYNINRYWKNGEIAKILLRKNQDVVNSALVKLPATVNEIGGVPADKVIETILAKYKNKVVFIDLWATWCVPCLDAMQQFQNTKNELQRRDVTFVYLTNTSSPRKLWQEKIKGIGNEHYYLTSSQWEYIMAHFGFEYIPAYLIYDKNGILMNKISPFPGNDKIKEMIKSL